jgi:hypothetical protein
VITIPTITERRYNAPKIVYGNPSAPMLKNKAVNTMNRIISIYAHIWLSPNVPYRYFAAGQAKSVKQI